MGQGPDVAQHALSCIKQEREDREGVEQVLGSMRQRYGMQTNGSVLPADPRWSEAYLGISGDAQMSCSFQPLALSWVLKFSKYRTQYFWECLSEECT
jgi:hypothetical protein